MKGERYVDEARTVALLTELLYTREPFVHIRFGDGDVFFATGTGPKITGDGEEWSPGLRDKLLDAWLDLCCPRNLLLGDLRTYVVSDGCEAEWDDLLALLNDVRSQPYTFVHMEALRVGFGYAAPFYEALANDQREKVFVGPERLAAVSYLLGCHHIAVPLQIAHEYADDAASAVIGTGADIAIFAAGRGGKIMQSKLSCARPNLTQIDIGSGLDLLIDDGVRRGTDRVVNRRKILRQYHKLGLVPQ